MTLTVRARSLFPADGEGDVVASGPDFEYGTCLESFTFKRASATGLLYLDPRPAESELSRIYPQDYLPYRFDALPPLISAARDMVQRGKVRALRPFVPAGGRILDVGCGSGRLLKLLRDFGDPTWELHGNDFKASVLDRLGGDGFPVHPGRLEDIPLAGSFDAVILNQVIEHMADIRGALGAIHKLLKPGGVVFIETPSFEGLDARLFQRRHWGGYHFPRHWYLFNAPLMSRVLEESGFLVLEVRYLASPSFWIQSFHHWLAERGWPRLARLFTVGNPAALAFFTLLDFACIRTGRPTSNMRVVAKRPVL